MDGDFGCQMCHKFVKPSTVPFLSRIESIESNPIHHNNDHHNIATTAAAILFASSCINYRCNKHQTTMVQGLAFLSKKSWHTKNVANQERVWIEEQKKAAEETKTKELAKQIQQEREQEDLDRIAGKKSNRLDRGIDWMYQGVTSEAAIEDAKKQAEEYLLGKEFTGGPAAVAAQPKGDLAQAENEKEGFNAVVAGLTADQPDDEPAPAPVFAMAGPSVAERNEAFRVQYEDPMFLVSQKRRDLVVKVEKKKALYEKVVGTVNDGDEEEEDSSKRRKKEKKERKKERKRHKEERRRHRNRSRSRSHSDDDDDDRRRSPEYRRGREESPDDRKRRSRYDDDSDEKDYRRERGDRRSRYDDERSREYDSRQREARHHGDDRHRAKRHHDDSASLRRENSRYDGRQDDRKRDDSGRQDGRKRDDSGRQDDRKRDNAGRQDDRKRDNSGSFGLQGSSKALNVKDLGPSRELLSQRRKQQETDHRRMPRDRRHVTPEEREQALRAMQSDASRHNANRLAARPVEQEEERKSAAFLHKMAQQTHGIRGEQQSMAERVAQNRHTNQRTHDSY